MSINQSCKHIKKIKEQYCDKSTRHLADQRIKALPPDQRELLMQVLKTTDNKSIQTFDQAEISALNKSLKAVPINASSQKIKRVWHSKKTPQAPSDTLFNLIPVELHSTMVRYLPGGQKHELSESLKTMKLICRAAPGDDCIYGAIDAQAFAYWVSLNKIHYAYLPQLEEKEITAFFPYLKHLNLQGISDFSWSLLDHCPHLESLQLPYDVKDIDLQHLSKLKKLKLLDLSTCLKFTDTGLSYLSGLTNLTSLNFSRCDQMTNTSLSHLSGLVNLTYLNLSWCYRITSTGLRHFSPLINLTTLHLLRCGAITDAGLPHLSCLVNLIFLDLSFCSQITNNGLSHLSCLVNLAYLNLSQCDKIRDDLASLSGLKNLASLELAGCSEITDAGLVHLFYLENLASLNLSRCDQITNSGVAQLSGLKNLTFIDLFYCHKITTAVRASLPGHVRIVK